MDKKHLVVGLGEIGQPIYQILKKKYKGTLGYDISTGDLEMRPEKLGSLHICIPWSENFIGTVKEYQAFFTPDITVIHSTVPVGVSDELKAIHSPVLGKHPNLLADIKKFEKWFGGRKAKEAANLFRKAGLKTHVVEDAKETEFLKLACLTKYGIDIVWADYMEAVRERHLWQIGFDHAWTRTYNRGVLKHLRRPIITAPFSKRIGGHCVVPGAKLLDKCFPHPFVSEVVKYG